VSGKPNKKRHDGHHTVCVPSLNLPFAPQEEHNRETRTSKKAEEWGQAVQCGEWALRAAVVPEPGNEVEIGLSTSVPVNTVRKFFHCILIITGIVTVHSVICVEHENKERKSQLL